MSTNDEPRARTDGRRRDRLLQQIIDAMTRDTRAWGAGAAARELERRIADHGLDPMPTPWLEAVAAGIARGDPYVVSPRTREGLDVPPPSTSRPPYGIS